MWVCQVSFNIILLFKRWFQTWESYTFERIWGGGGRLPDRQEITWTVTRVKNGFRFYSIILRIKFLRSIAN
jgi:hypothetical protein